MESEDEDELATATHTLVGPGGEDRRSFVDLPRDSGVEAGSRSAFELSRAT